MRPAHTRSHFLSGATLPNLLRVIFRNRSQMTPAHLLPVLLILITPLLLYPLYLLERLLFSRRINQTRIVKDPVFIIGHFRSGTTYLHNLLSQDPQFGYPSTYHCFVPGTFLTGGKWLKAIHKTTLPEKRPMDKVILHQDFPQEEEFALLTLTPWSYYQCYFFPRKTREYFTRYAMVSDEIAGRWEKAYLFIIRKMTMASDGKQLVLKNPVNTARLSRLQKLFPEAKFIYLRRDPAEVLRSTHKLFDKFLDRYSFQKIGAEELTYNIRWVFQQMTRQYGEQKKTIRKENLAEISYHDLVGQPLQEIRRIYRELGLSGFEASRSRFESYIATQENFVRDP